MGEMRNACVTLVGKPEGTRLLGRSRRRSEANTIIDVRKIVLEGMGWIHLAQDRDRGRVLVNSVNEPPVSIKGKSFLDQLSVLFLSQEGPPWSQLMRYCF
jgi:hypothetical protein